MTAFCEDIRGPRDCGNGWTAVGAVSAAGIGDSHIASSMVVSKPTKPHASLACRRRCGVVSKNRGGCVIRSGAAVLLDKGKRLVDRRILRRRAAHHPSFPLLCDEAGGDKTAQMEGERRGRHAEIGLQFADSEASATCSDEQTNNLQAGRIAEFSQASGGGVDVHMRHMA